MEKQRVKEKCLPCKIITVSCLTSMGTYLIYTARKYKQNAKIFTTILGSGIVCLGIGEIFDKSPFRQHSQDV